MGRTGRWLTAVVGILAILGLVAVATPIIWAMPGLMPPVDLMEQLDDPQQVVGWTDDGLRLANGDLVMPEGMTKLPKRSDALQALVARGVEIKASGHVVGLLPIWHWCGNDAVRFDLQRVDAADLLTYYREGTSTRRFDRSARAPFKMRPGFGGGWPISDLVAMRFASRRTAEERTTPSG